MVKILNRFATMRCDTCVVELEYTLKDVKVEEIPSFHINEREHKSYVRTIECPICHKDLIVEYTTEYEEVENDR